MSIANKYNKVKIFNFQIPKTFTYKSLHDLFNTNGAEHIYKVNAMYVNKKGKFGESPIIATDNELVNLPSHLIETVKEMMKDDEVIEVVNHGKLGFKIYTYETAQRKEVCYSINWVDC